MGSKASNDNNDAIVISELLRAAGYDTPSSLKRARAVLESAGLTRPGKRALAAYKREAALDVLATKLIRVCGRECASLAYDGREPVLISGGTCEICRGSNNRRAAMAAHRAMLAAGTTRLLVVGGTLQQHHDVAALLGGGGLTVVCVDGSGRSHTQKDAIANMRRADVLVIWGSTPLKHAVSELYTREPLAHLRVIKFSKRGIEALCREIETSFRRKP